MHKHLAKIIFILLIITAFFAGVSFADSNSVRVRLDGTEVIGDTPPTIVNGRTLIPVRSIFEAMGGTVTWDQATREVTVNIRDNVVRLKIDSKIAYINDVKKEIDVPAMIINSRTMIPVRFLSEAVGLQVSWDNVNRVVDIISPDDNSESVEIEPEPIKIVDPEQNIFTKEELALLEQYDLPMVESAARHKLVVIDAGHGGADTGARGYENGAAVLNEKDVNLDIALRIQDMLRAAGAKIYMIRTTDVTIPLYDRQDTANGLGASLYVSIHNNSYKTNIPNGTEVLYFSSDQPAMDGISGMELAGNLQETLVTNLGLTDRGAKAKPELAVLRRTIMPAVIIEGAFMSNLEDLNYMKTDEFRELYAKSTAQCIIEALNQSVE